MKRKLAALVLTGVMALSLTAATQAFAADDEVYTLSINYSGPESNNVAAALMMAGDQVTEASDGRIQFEYYWNGNYVSYEESIQGTIDDVVDICYVDSGSINQVCNVNQILTLPYTTDLPTRAGAHEVMQQALAEIPDLQNEMNDIGLMWLCLTNMGGMVIHWADDRDVGVPADIKGLIIDAPANSAAMVQAVGASAMDVDISEFYTNLERGVFDGIFHNWDAYNVFALDEVCKSHTVFSDVNEGIDGGGQLWMAGSGLIMNKEKFDSLPEDLQQILSENILKFGEEWAANSIPIAEEGYQKSIDANHTFHVCTPEERQEWINIIEETTPEVLDKLSKASGLDVAADYDKLCELMQAKYDEEQANKE